MGMTHLKVESL